MGTCKNCGVSIVWVKSNDGSKWLKPLDHVAIGLVPEDNEIAIDIVAGEWRQVDPPTVRLHKFHTCVPVTVESNDPESLSPFSAYQVLQVCKLTPDQRIDREKLYDEALKIALEKYWYTERRAVIMREPCMHLGCRAKAGEPCMSTGLNRDDPAYRYLKAPHSSRIKQAPPWESPAMLKRRLLDEERAKERKRLADERAVYDRAMALERERMADYIPLTSKRQLPISSNAEREALRDWLKLYADVLFLEPSANEQVTDSLTNKVSIETEPSGQWWDALLVPDSQA